MKNYLITTLIIALFINSVLSQNMDTKHSHNAMIFKIKPSKKNPRNSEGDFIELRDGRILFIYSHFTSGDGDYASAYLAQRISHDWGKTWGEERKTVANEGGLNTMSVSLLRLQSGEIALFYARKNSHKDCRPVMRISKDEAKTWSDPVDCIPETVGYFVLNNDRVIQLANGRIILPVSLHESPDTPWSDGGILQTYYSDDNGNSWYSGKIVANPDNVVLQEPGMIVLEDNRIMMFIRTNAGVQYTAFSSDDGISWTAASASNIPSPLSPASIKRIPSSGDLLMAWNNNNGKIEAIKGKRTPFSIAISEDEGQTWKYVKNIEDNPDGWYCYTAIDFTGDHVLLGYCGGNRTENNGLAETHIARVNLDWIYSGE
ncbi:MAG: exo-alpha-sialidase [Saprospiraceae bacterium]|nr:exo-alpha-sialidase [Saprospiraceae bacterium]